jgi:hypothetical protein
MTSGPYGAGPYGDDAAATGPYGNGLPAAGQPETPAYPQSGHPTPGYPSQSYPSASYPSPSYQNAAYGQPGYPQPSHAQPAYPAYAPAYVAPAAAPIGYGSYPAPRNGLGTAALVLGIIGVVLCWVPFTGWALNILAIIFGAVGRKRAADGLATNKSSAVAGLVLGVVGLGVWIVIIVMFVSAVGTIGVGVGAIGT